MLKIENAYERKQKRNIEYLVLRVSYFSSSRYRQILEILLCIQNKKFNEFFVFWSRLLFSLEIVLKFLMISFKLSSVKVSNEDEISQNYQIFLSSYVINEWCLLTRHHLKFIWPKLKWSLTFECTLSNWPPFLK